MHSRYKYLEEWHLGRRLDTTRFIDRLWCLAPDFNSFCFAVSLICLNVFANCLVRPTWILFSWLKGDRCRPGPLWVYSSFDFFRCFYFSFALFCYFWVLFFDCSILWPYNVLFFLHYISILFNFSLIVFFFPSTFPLVYNSLIVLFFDSVNLLVSYSLTVLFFDASFLWLCYFVILWLYYSLTLRSGSYIGNFSIKLPVNIRQRATHIVAQ